MSNKNQRYLTLADFQKFLQHRDPVIRLWALHCTEEQYPDRFNETVTVLFGDSDVHLQISAIRAIGELGDTSFEPALLELWSNSEGSIHNWCTMTLGRLQNQTILPSLIAEVEAIPDQPLQVEDTWDWRPEHGVVKALGFYPDKKARETLWQLVARYPADDRLMYNAIEGLLSFIEPKDVPRLLAQLASIEPRENGWWRANRILAQAVDSDDLAANLNNVMADGFEALIDFLDYWFIQFVPFSDTFLDVLELASINGYQGLFPHMVSELEQTTAARNDDLAAFYAQWQSGKRPTGYPWRTVFAHQVLLALAEHPPLDQERHWASVALGLALLAQTLADEDDEAALQAAPNEMFRQATLLSITSSTRPNVLPDIVDRVAALGPGVVPHLIEILESDSVWAWLRAIPAIAKIARTHQGAADEAVRPILDLIDPNQDDRVLEATSEALIAIGPGAIEAIGERLGQDYVYDIYAGGALCQTPTEASVETMLHYLTHKDSLDEYELEGLADLGHPAPLFFLRDGFDWRDDPRLCTVLYTLAVVTGYKGPEVRRWRSVARRHYRAVSRASKLRSSE